MDPVSVTEFSLNHVASPCAPMRLSLQYRLGVWENTGGDGRLAETAWRRRLRTHSGNDIVGQMSDL